MLEEAHGCFAVNAQIRYDTFLKKKLSFGLTAVVDVLRRLLATVDVSVNKEKG